MSDVFPRLWRYCLALTGSRDDANDLAQAACLRALEKSDSFELGTHLDRWIFRLAQRLWLNELRALSVRRGAGLVPIEDLDLAANLPDAEHRMLTQQVLRAVGDLPVAQRTTLVLVYVEGFSYKEAAGILDIPIGTVMSRLSAARVRLAQRLCDIESRTG